MRRINAILTPLILALFLLHAIAGGFQLLGLGQTALKAVGFLCLGLIAVHACIGVKLTVDSILIWRKTGVGYFRENRMFWLRRISGFAVLVFLLLHLLAFHGTGDGGGYRLPWFTAGKLIAQLLLILSIGVHGISNLRPSMLSLGAVGLKRWAVDILLVLAVLLLFMGAAFLVYYLRWNVW